MKFLLCAVACTLLAAAPADARRTTVIGELKRMEASGAITHDEYVSHRRAYEGARAFARRLKGARRVNMSGAIRAVEGIAARGALTVSRLAPLWLTLRRNREYWASQPLPANGQRFSFPGSELVWQFFPGQGWHLHPLANFAKLNALWQGRIYDDRLAVLLDELLPLAADRAGGLAWEYYFAFNGGRAPWVSALAQATALQALARAGIRLQRKEEVLAIAREGVRLFQTAPPSGVRKRVDGGAHYLLYSFRPRLYVLNGFVQSLVGLHDFGKYDNNDVVRALVADGDAAARREVRAHDTGFWSLYSRGEITRESDLHYHRLVRGFLAGLCERIPESVYCEAHQAFGDYLVEKPVLELRTERVRAGTTASLRFRLSKISRVTVRVARGSKLVHQWSGVLRYGARSVAWRVPRKAGDHSWRVTATDLAGNTGSAGAELEVLKARKRRG